jgi:hypothetical protein
MPADLVAAAVSARSSMVPRKAPALAAGLCAALPFQLVAASPEPTHFSPNPAAATWSA